ncbi:MAG TPA: DUF4386 domain-containing protein, partial [Chthoniobacterales bacterium]|nr:DUF4386 domain-containing protein [Chthoniobacterales bacterium]
MTTNRIDIAQRTAAKVAGLSYLFSFAIVVFSNYVLLNPLIVPRNATDTARNILAHPTQFRIALTLFLTYSIGTVVLAGALYIILRPINHYLALLGALFRVVFAMSWLLSAIHSLGALRLLGSASYLQVIEPDRLQALARVTLASTFDDYYVGLPFFGLAATVCAWLWIKSGYIPRGLAIFGFLASAWCVICAVVYLIFPDFNKVVNDYIFDTPMALFELAVSFWLLFKGIAMRRD